MVWILLLGFVWIEDAQKDFSDGIWSVNIYVSARNGGCIEFIPRYDLNLDGYMDLMSVDEHGPHLTIYWGSSEGYSNSNQDTFPISAGADADVADLNHDGYPDIVLSLADAKETRIFWGSREGFSCSNITSLPAGYEPVFIADFNRDGWLDIASSITNSTVGIYLNCKGSFYSDSVIILGDGFTYPAHNAEVADFNKDGWLDVLFVNYGAPGPHKIFWGSPEGYDSTNYTSLTFPSAHGASVADFNKDGWLDVVLTGFGRITYAFIYYGSSKGFVQPPESLNCGDSFGGSIVYDFNKDGWLDILFIRAYSGGYPVIYYGSSDGFSDENICSLSIYVYGSGGLVADFNRDRYVDIFINDHHGQSKVLWGPDFTHYTLLMCNEDHHGMFREIGNVYTREYKEVYLSSIFDAGRKMQWYCADWKDSLPEGSTVRMFVRGGLTADTTEWNAWMEVNKNDPFFMLARFAQYKLELSYENPVNFPSVERVEIYYKYPGPFSIFPDTFFTMSPGDTLEYTFLVLSDTTDPIRVNFETYHTSSGWKDTILLEDTDFDGRPDGGTFEDSLYVPVRIYSPLEEGVDTFYLAGFLRTNPIPRWFSSTPQQVNFPSRPLKLFTLQR